MWRSRSRPCSSCISTSPLREIDDIPIGEDAAGGGVDLDATVSYDLTNALIAIDPHPIQGWHVKLTVHAEGSQGADTKYKVFWALILAAPDRKPG